MKLRKKLLLIGLPILAICVAVPVWRNHQAKDRLERYHAELTARGAWLDLSEIIPNPSIESNGVPAFLRAVEQLPSLPPADLSAMEFVSPGRARLSWRCASLPTDRIADLWPILDEHFGSTNRAALEAVKASLTGPLAFRPDYAQDYSREFNITPRHVVRARTAAQWLCHATVLQLHRGDSATALEDLLSCLALIDRWHREPLMAAEMVRCSIGVMAANTTWEVLHAPDLTEAQLRQLQEAWMKTDFTPDLVRVLAFERYFRVQQIQNRREDFSGRPPTDGSWIEFKSYLRFLGNEPRQGFNLLMERYPRYWTWRWRGSYADELETLRNWQTVIDEVQQRKAEGRSVFAEFDEVFRLPLDIGPANFARRGWRSDSRLSRLLSQAAATGTARNLTIAAIALKRWHLRHGTYPATLANLVPEFLETVPRDSVGDIPFVYEPIPDGTFLLYAIGEDGIDDGGNASVVQTTTRRRLSWDDTSFLSGRDWVWPMAASPAEVDEFHEQLAATRISLFERTSQRRNYSEPGELSDFVQQLVSVLGLKPVASNNAAELR